MKLPSRQTRIRLQWLSLALVFIACCLIVYWRQSPDTDDRTVLRVSHLFREPDAERALEDIAREYSRLHPDVTVKFIKVPRNLFLQWFRTQLLTDTPPDIIHYDLWHRDLRQMVAQGFDPLNELVEQPNPYNTGTIHEGVPLKDTYIDNLRSKESFFPEMGTYFGLPYRAVTLRVLYNRDLMETITGDPDTTPRNWREFMALCQQTKEYAEANDLDLFPVAADRMGVYLMGNEAAIGASQRLALRTNYDYDLTLIRPNLYPALRYLRDEWDFHSPELLAGLEIYREVASYLQPGFIQFQPSDVNFQFLQGHALMTISGGPSLTSQATFPLGAFRIPGLDPSNDTYGVHSLGPYSEAEHATTYAFGIPRRAQHKTIAHDFLQFLTSYKINEQFTNAIGEVPVIRNVPATPLAQKFLPHVDGYIYGILPRAIRGVNSEQLFNGNLHLLFRDGVETFITALETKGMKDAARRDLNTVLKNYQSNLQETDASLTARYFQQPETIDHPSPELDRAVLLQTMFELDAMRIAYSLEQATDADH